MFFEYQVAYLSPGAPTPSLEALGRDGWEVCERGLPWVILRRAIEDGSRDQAKPVLPRHRGPEDLNGTISSK
jgi:hypothetical protein